MIVIVLIEIAVTVHLVQIGFFSKKKKKKKKFFSFFFFSFFFFFFLPRGDHVAPSYLFSFFFLLSPHFPHASSSFSLHSHTLQSPPPPSSFAFLSPLIGSSSFSLAFFSDDFYDSHQR